MQESVIYILHLCARCAGKCISFVWWNILGKSQIALLGFTKLFVLFVIYFVTRIVCTTLSTLTESANSISLHIAIRIVCRDFNQTLSWYKENLIWYVMCNSQQRWAVQFPPMSHYVCVCVFFYQDAPEDVVDNKEGGPELLVGWCSLTKCMVMYMVE